MQIAVGSKNPAKVDAVRLACHDLQLGGTVVGIAVASGVSKQPFSDEETITGAINRARAVLQQMRVQHSESHDAEGFNHTELHRAYGEPLAYGIGLEGGVVETPHGLFVCNWGAVVCSDGAVGIGGGHRVQLPPAVAEQLRGRHRRRAPRATAACRRRAAVSRKGTRDSDGRVDGRTQCKATRRGNRRADGQPHHARSHVPRRRHLCVCTVCESGVL